MTDFPLVQFPFEFECPDCPYGSTVEITREDVSDLPPMTAGPTLRHTVNEALRSKGWWEISGQRRCPKCTQELSSDTSSAETGPTEDLPDGRAIAAALYGGETHALDEDHGEKEEPSLFDEQDSTDAP